MKRSKYLIPVFFNKMTFPQLSLGRSFPPLLLVFLILEGCGEKGQPNLMPETNGADSVAILYYKTPGNPRFFTFSKSRDTNQMQVLSRNINEPARHMKKDCATEGKIFFYRGTEEAYPVYFSLQEGCEQLYFIRTGEKYFVKLREDVKKVLAEWKKDAREPAPE